MGALSLARGTVNKRLRKQVLPLVCEELKVSVLPDRQYLRWFSQKTFKGKTLSPENPLSLQGQLGDNSFIANVIRVRRMKERTFWDFLCKNMPQVETVFEGIHVVIACKKAWPKTLVTHADSPINPGRLMAVKVDAAGVQGVSVWSDNPKIIHHKFNPGFLKTITEWDGTPEDLPMLDMLVTDDRVELYIPEKMALFEPSYRLSAPYETLDPVITMLTSWSILKKQLEVLMREFPELFAGNRF